MTGTRFLTLSTRPDRMGGEVTVGVSHLPVAPILAMLRAHGMSESLREHGMEQAALMWPQLREEDLDVLAQLAADSEQHEADREDDAAGGVILGETPADDHRTRR